MSNVSVSVVIVFSLFRIYFFGFMWKSNKVFNNIKIFWTVHSRPYIRSQGKSVHLFLIWCCFNFSCIALCNLTKLFTFSFIPFISYGSVSESFTQSNFTLYASEIFFFKVFINACFQKMTDEMPICWRFSIGFWHSVNSLSVPVTDWTLSWSSIQWVCL